MSTSKYYTQRQSHNKNQQSYGARNYSSSSNWSGSSKVDLNNKLKEYHNFCQKYLGNTTPIASIPEKKFDQIIDYEEESQPNIIPNPMQILDNDDLDFTWEKNTEDILGSFLKTPGLSLPDTHKIGFEKNSKADYAHRLQRGQTTHQPQNQVQEEEENYEDDFNYQEEKEEKKESKTTPKEEESGKNESKEKSKTSKENPGQIFDEKTHKIINDQAKNVEATKIQVYFRQQKCPKRLRDRVYFGYDKTSKYIVWVYIDKKEPKDAKEKYEVKSLFFKIYSLENKVMTVERKTIKDLLSNDSVNIDQLNKEIPDILEKVLNQDKEDDESGYGFEDAHIEKKTIKDDSEASISSIGKVDYENI